MHLPAKPSSARRMRRATGRIRPVASSKRRLIRDRRSSSGTNAKPGADSARARRCVAVVWPSARITPAQSVSTGSLSSNRTAGYIQTGIGNLGTESWSDCQRVSAEMMGMPWEKVDITWGDTSKNLPWSCVSGGSQTTHAMTRAAHAAASDGIKKLQQIAAKDFGGRPDDYVVANERVSRK